MLNQLNVNTASHSGGALTHHQTLLGILIGSLT